MDKRCFLITFFCFCSTPAGMGSKNHIRIEAVEGRDVKLPCWADMGDDPKGYLDIEWKFVGTNESVIMMYSGGRVYNYLPSVKSERFSFASSNVRAQHASLHIRALVLIDSGNYHCKIKQGAAHYQSVVTLNVIQGRSVKNLSSDDSFTTWSPAIPATVTEDIMTTGHSNNTQGLDWMIFEISIPLVLVFLLFLILIHTYSYLFSCCKGETTRPSSGQIAGEEFQQVQEVGIIKRSTEETTGCMSQNTAPASTLNDSDEIAYASLWNLRMGSEQNEPMDSHQDIVYASVH